MYGSKKSTPRFWSTESGQTLRDSMSKSLGQTTLGAASRHRSAEVNKRGACLATQELDVPKKVRKYILNHCSPNSADFLLSDLQVTFVAVVGGSTHSFGRKMRPSTSLTSASALALGLAGTGSASTGDFLGNLFANKREACPAEAACTVKGPIQRYTWAKIEEPSTVHEFVAYTVVTFVNTIQNKNWTSTEWAKIPTNSPPPPITHTENGNRIDVVSYTLPNGQVTTTSV